MSNLVSEEPFPERHEYGELGVQPKGTEDARMISDAGHPVDVNARPQLRLNQGGLMRCCIASIPDDIEDTWTEGQELLCLDEHKVTMVIENAIIRWVGGEGQFSKFGGHNVPS